MTAWVLILVVSMAAQPVYIEFSSDIRCLAAQHSVKDQFGTLVYAECFPK